MQLIPSHRKKIGPPWPAHWHRGKLKTGDSQAKGREGLIHFYVYVGVNFCFQLTFLYRCSLCEALPELIVGFALLFGL